MKLGIQIKGLIIFFIFITCTISYLQFKLVRVPHSTKFYSYDVLQCLADLPKQKEHKNRHKNKVYTRMLTNKKRNDDENKNEYEEEDQTQFEQEENKLVEDKDNFKQICYQKDISYSIELFNKKKQMMLLSADLTAPISWIKGQKCYIAQTHKKCQRIQKNYRDQIQKISKKFKELFKNILDKKQKKSSSSVNDQYALIQGSSQVLKGILQKTQALEFQTADSGRLTRFFDLMMVGMFFMEVNSQIKLQNTTFINATQISPALNYLCDGAISLRFDQNSQSSFLKEMSVLAQTTELYVTIFLGHQNQTITIGDLSVKNAAYGRSGIKWVPIEQDQEHGKLPRSSSIQLTISNSQVHKQISIKLPLVLTLSSSSITIPKQQLQQIFTNFFPKKSCSINETTRFIYCKKLSASDYQTKQLNFVTNQSNIMIPFKNLVLQQKKHKITFNIKSSLDSRYIILGEPIFKIYFVVLDYQNNRVGFAQQTKKFSEFINPVKLIRFVVWGFILGSLLICFRQPLQKSYIILINKIIQAKNSRSKTKNYSGTTDERSKICYKAVEQQNLYEDLKRKMEQSIDEQAMGI